MSLPDGTSERNGSTIDEERDMTVAELILFLQKQPQDLPVAFQIYSEHCLLKETDIEVEEHCLPRNDGWVEYRRPDKPAQKYLLFPGN
jgi:hypothetical protein